MVVSYGRGSSGKKGRKSSYENSAVLRNFQLWDNIRRIRDKTRFRFPWKNIILVDKQGEKDDLNPGKFLLDKVRTLATHAGALLFQLKTRYRVFFTNAPRSVILINASKREEER